MRLILLSAPPFFFPPPALAGIRPSLIPLGFSHRRPLNSSGPLGFSFADGCIKHWVHHASLIGFGQARGLVAQHMPKMSQPAALGLEVGR